MNGRGVARIATILLGVIAAVSVGGLIGTAIISSTKYNEFGEIPIPGSAVIELPEGEIIASFHVKTSGRGTAVPPLTLSIEPPPGGRDPDVVDDLGDSIRMNNDVRRQVWVMQVTDAGRYQVSIDGGVADFEDPKLAFGRERGMDALLWVLVATSVISIDLLVAVFWFRRVRSRRG